MTAPTRLLYGFPIDAMTMEEAVQRCRAAIASRQPVLVGVLNAAKLVASRRDERLPGGRGRPAGARRRRPAARALGARGGRIPAP